MQKVNFHIHDQLGDQIDAAIKKWGYAGRAEFFRSLAIQFLQEKTALVPPEEVINDYTEALNRVRLSQGRECFWPKGTMEGLSW